MALEIISELEEKVDRLIGTVQNLRKENEGLEERIREKDKKIEEFETERTNFNSAMDSLKGDSEDGQRKLDAATEKIQNIILKLESVE